MQGILTNKPVVVCHKAALFLIGVSAQRVQRVLEGQQYGRKKGPRLPNDSRTSGLVNVCLRFLWRTYHFDAEGLPDKLSIERHGMTSMTIGTQGHPNITTIPARSALQPLGEVGPVCAPTSSLTGTSDRISLEGDVTSSELFPFGIPSFAFVSVALSSLLDGASHFLVKGRCLNILCVTG